MKPFAATSLFAIAIAAAAAPPPARAQDVPAGTPSPAPGPFRLPPASTPTPSDVQGPVDPDAPILTRPRAPTPTPTPRAAPTPTPTPAARPLPTPTPTPRSTEPPRGSTLPPRFTPPAAPTAQEAADAEANSADLFPAPPAATGPAPSASAAALPAGANAAPPAGSSAAEGNAAGGWLYALGGLLVLAGGGAAALAYRKRRADGPVEVAAIERPKVGAARPAAPPAAPTPANPLSIEARAIKLSRTMMFATLSYELVVTNRSGRPLEDLHFGGDLVTAHARVPTTAQLADPAVPLAPMQGVARLEPGESARLAGDLRIAVSEIRPIPHGSAVVYVPLLRVRAEAAGVEPVARTFVVGLLPPGVGAKLQPFRLDEMPQTYVRVGQRPLD